MATPEELARLKGNPQTGAVNMPGVDPITPGSFQPGGPPDPGKMQPEITLPDQRIGPEITLPDQQIGSGFTPPPLQAATAVPNPSAFPGNPPNAAQAEIEAHPPEPVEEPIVYGNTPLNLTQQLEQQAKDAQGIAEARRNEGRAISQGKLDEASLHSKTAQDLELRLQSSDAGMLNAKAATDLGFKEIDAKIANAQAMSVDPDRYWKRKGTANNIMSAIAIGLGSVASGLSGGATGNPALTLVTSAIEHDIDAQKSDIDNYWKVIKEKKGLVDSAWNRDLVMQNYQANAMVAGLKIYEMNLKSIGAKTDSMVVKASTERMIAESKPAVTAAQGQAWATQMAIDAANRKEKLAQQAARGAQVTAATKERNAQFTVLRDQNLKAGMDIKEAEASAWSSVDDMYPQTYGTPYASPGQKYQGAVRQAAAEAKQSVIAGKKMTEDQIVGAVLAKDPKTSLDEARAIAKMAKAGDVDGLTVKILNQAGMSDPYKSVNTSGSPGAVIDSATGKSVTITTKNRDQVVVGPDGKQYLMPSDDSAKQVKAITMLTKSIDADLDTLKAIGKKYGGNISNWASMTKEDRLKMDNARYKIAAGAAKLKNPTAEPSDDVINQNLANVPDVTSLAGGNPEKWVENYRNQTHSDARATFNAHSGGQQIAAPPEEQEPKEKEDTSKHPFTKTGSGGKPQPFTPKDPDKGKPGRNQ